jgi:hypothetical protein
VHPQYEVSPADLAGDPHPLLARLRERAPVCWVPGLGAWLVTGYAAAVEVLLDPAVFTVDDPRFTTARVTGPSMLSLDGDGHARHRAPFTHAYRPAELSKRLAAFARAEAARLTDAIRPAGQAELRTAVAGPLAAAVMTEALGLGAAGVTPVTVLAWYRDIVAAVAAMSAAAPGSPSAVRVGSFDALAARLRAAIADGRAPVLAGAARSGELSVVEVLSKAAVQLFGGIETTEAMICNAVLHLLSDPAQLGLVRADPGLLPAAVEESLRLEPAAAVVDRYATRDASVGGAGIRTADPVTVSLAGANRDPAVFPDPDRYDIRRPNSARHLAFARGPHFCLGAHLARAEATAAVAALLAGLPELSLDQAHPSAPHGLIFRKPAALRVRWAILFIRNGRWRLLHRHIPQVGNGVGNGPGPSSGGAGLPLSIRTLTWFPPQTVRSRTYQSPGMWAGSQLLAELTSRHCATVTPCRASRGRTSLTRWPTSWFRSPYKGSPRVKNEPEAGYGSDWIVSMTWFGAHGVTSRTYQVPGIVPGSQTPLPCWPGPPSRHWATVTWRCASSGSTSLSGWPKTWSVRPCRGSPRLNAEPATVYFSPGRAGRPIHISTMLLKSTGTVKPIWHSVPPRSQEPGALIGLISLKSYLWPEPVDSKAVVPM